MATTHPWTQRHLADWFLQENVPIDTFSLARLRRGFVRDFWALDSRTRELLAEFGQNHRIGFLNGTIQKYMGSKVYAQWLRYLGMTDVQMISLHAGDHAITQQLLRSYIDLFGILPWWLVAGEPPFVGHLHPDEDWGWVGPGA